MESKNVEERFVKLKEDALASGYTLNPDDEMVRGLAEGLIENKQRYGIESCPCRLFKGTAQDNLDIVCPCDYRDDDLGQFGACFCALYVSPEVAKEGLPQMQVPERRPTKKEREQKKNNTQKKDVSISDLKYPVWRCNVCGYLCANNYPPHICPICKAQKERFSKFL